MGSRTNITPFIRHKICQKKQEKQVKRDIRLMIKIAKKLFIFILKTLINYKQKIDLEQKSF